MFFEFECFDYNDLVCCDDIYSVFPDMYVNDIMPAADTPFLNGRFEREVFHTDLRERFEFRDIVSDLRDFRELRENILRERDYNACERLYERFASDARTEKTHSAFGETLCVNGGADGIFYGGAVNSAGNAADITREYFSKETVRNMYFGNADSEFEKYREIMKKEILHSDREVNRRNDYHEDSRTRPNVTVNMTVNNTVRGNADTDKRANYEELADVLICALEEYFY